MPLPATPARHPAAAEARYGRTSLAKLAMHVETSVLLAAWATHLSNRANTLVLRAAHVPTRTLRSIEMTSASAQHTTPAMA